jgi:hypothetical protein
MMMMMIEWVPVRKKKEVCENGCCLKKEVSSENGCCLKCLTFNSRMLARPKLSSSPHAHSFVIGPAVIKHKLQDPSARSVLWKALIFQE